MAYATADDITTRGGLPSSALVASVRAVEAVDLATARFTVSGHGLTSADSLRFVASGSPVSGTPTPALPSALSASTVYWALPVSGTEDIFRVSTTENGAPITSLSSAQVGNLGIVVAQGRRIQAVLDSQSDWVDQFLTANKTPFASVPDVVRFITAVLSAAQLVLSYGLQQTPYGIAIQANAEMIRKHLEFKLRNGLPIVNATDLTPATFEAGPVHWAADARGWDPDEDAELIQ